MKRLRSIALIVTLVALLPCVVLPYMAIGANIRNAVTDIEWFQLYAEQYIGPVVAILCGGVALGDVEYLQHRWIYLFFGGGGAHDRCALPPGKDRQAISRRFSAPA